jgi:hypothetical protein
MTRSSPDHRDMIYILTSERGSHLDIVRHFESQGARFIDSSVDSAQSENIILGKFAFVLSMLRARLWQLRPLISRHDRVIVYGWHAIPLLFLMKMGLLARPRKLVVTSLYIQTERTRRLVNRALRWLKFDRLEVIAYSPSEVENLVVEAGLDRSNIHYQIWRLNLDGRVPFGAVRDDGYVFSGGYSNRDYDTLLHAANEAKFPLVIAASRRNSISGPIGPHVQLHLDIGEADFELLLAASRVCVIPLLDKSDACGLSVLLRVLRNSKPLIATRHDAIEAYLGPDYPGYVSGADSQGLRRMLERAMTESEFRQQLVSGVQAAQRSLDALDTPGEEVFKLVAA